MNNTVVNGADSFDYAYIYKDHLGNNRLTYGVDRTTGVMKIMEENHYYPYGLKHGSYNTERNEFQKQESTVVLKGPANPDPGNTDAAVYPFKYRYNGKEYQDEIGLNLYDYGARNYDPAIGRWMNINPLAETSRRWTPYNYCYNNPVFFIDPDGMESGAPDGFVDAGYGRMVSVRTMSMSMEYSNLLGLEDPEMPVENGETDPPKKDTKKDGKISSMAIESIDMKDRMLTGYPGQALDELITAGIQWVGTKVSGSDVSKETSENVQLATTLAVVIFSKGKNGKADTELAEATGFSITDAFKKAISQFKNSNLTNVGRAVTKHPQYFGFESTEALMKAYKSSASLNKLGSSTLKDIIRNGVKTTGAGGRYPNGWVTFTLPNGKAASWGADGSFIGFRGLKQ